MKNTSTSTSTNTGIYYDGSLESFDYFTRTLNLDWIRPESIFDFVTKDDTRLRVANWLPKKNIEYKGLVVFFSGRTEYIEKNIYSYSDLVEVGYEVWTLDWRGQGLSDREVQSLGHIDSFDTYVDDAHQFVFEIVGIDKYEKVPKILMAHSMGGAIATKYIQDYPGVFDYAVLSAPMMGLGVDNFFTKIVLDFRNPKTCANPFASSCEWSSNVKSYTNSCDRIKGISKDTFKKFRKTKNYSHDLVKLVTQDCIIRASQNLEGSPTQLGTGAPSSSWVRAAITFMQEIYQARNKTQTPTLIVGGSADKIVKNSDQIRFCGSIPEYCCRVEIDSAYHEVLIEKEPIRKVFFGLFSDFVGKQVSVSEWCSVRETLI